jgi:hypothetical protein
MQLYCLDFNHSVYFGQQWTAQVQKLSPANMAGYQYGAINASFVNAPGDPLFARYQSAAWLFTQEGPAPTTRALGVYEFAAWELFLDSAHQAEFDAGFNSIDDVDPITHHTFQFDVAQALAAALSPANYGKVDLSRWNVVSPANAGTPNSVQEFLTPVPEPSLAILTAISVLGLIAFGRRRRTT